MPLLATYANGRVGYRVNATLKHQKHLGLAHIYGMELVTRNEFYPEARVCPDKPYSYIVVDIYEVSDGALTTMDWDEVHPTFLTRKIARALMHDSIIDVFVYVQEDLASISHLPTIPNGDWKEYVEHREEAESIKH